MHHYIEQTAELKQTGSVLCKMKWQLLNITYYCHTYTDIRLGAA